MDVPVSTIDALRARLNDNVYIRWVGSAQNMRGDCRVCLSTRVGSAINTWVDVMLPRDFEGFTALENHEPMFESEPGPDIARGPRVTDEQWAAILGVNVGGSCVPGGGSVPIPVSGCACGYDIEVDISDLHGSQFPLPDAHTRILSVALWCSCGFKWSCATQRVSNANVVRASCNTELVSMFLDAVASHMPLWLVGWNCFSFDNLSLEASAEGVYSGMFRRTTVRISSGNKSAYSIEVPGVYNVDLYVYLDRTRRHMFNSLKLGDVAAQLGAPLKTAMPSVHGEVGADEMLEYNMNDSMVTSELWRITRVEPEILSLCVVSCSPIHDCIRYITGQMSVSLVASQCLEEGRVFSWGTCSSPPGYTGGYVMDPMRGIHDDVVLCDYSSMYPTIITSCNISPESMLPCSGDAGGDGRVDWDSSVLTVRSGGLAVSFDRGAKATVPRLVKDLVVTRSRYRASMPAYAVALKVLSNSIYGAWGYEHSAMYSPSCSSSVTAVGRWCLTVAAGIFSGCGMQVVYGDTDSCFVNKRQHGDTGGESNASRCSRILSIITAVFEYTPMSGMKMLLETTLSRMLLVGKKNYAYIDPTSRVRFKGVSVVRKDAIGIKRKLAERCITTILRSESKHATLQALAAMLSDAICSCALRTLSLSDVSKVRKVDGSSCYEYTASGKRTVALKVDNYTGDEIVGYDIEVVCRALKDEMERYTIVAGYGGCSEIIRYSDPFATPSYYPDSIL